MLAWIHELAIVIQISTTAINYRGIRNLFTKSNHSARRSAILMKTTSLALLASTACATLAFAVDSDPAARQYQVYPKNLARQHMGSNLFVYSPTSQTYVPTEASAAWLDDDVTTGWPVLAGKQHYLLALSEPELVSNFSVSARPTDGTLTLSGGDEPAVPGASSWTPLAQKVPFNGVNERKLDKPFTRFAKYILIETDLA